MPHFYCVSSAAPHFWIKYTVTLSSYIPVLLRELLEKMPQLWRLLPWQIHNVWSPTWSFNSTWHLTLLVYYNCSLWRKWRPSIWTWKYLYSSVCPCLCPSGPEYSMTCILWSAGPSGVPTFPCSARPGSLYCPSCLVLACLLHAHPRQSDFPKTQILLCHHLPKLLFSSSPLLLDWGLDVSV